ncbi:hypothetical protein BIU88_01010 [Chlorobaculum limnaeum]|uniref:Glycosyltransferase RgtA/B/C/D-like domain-containing protein n=1 Tax=Chlorobaculum limnaeum TaxID=274537 RepID=A0A1D8CYG1_CHLLM|nr:hypothetical protein [Chlorobaculum limnaeum]AOS82853.1 hypothetical protein BIU88_01010 [Chlorobaculum limnaeum]
MLKNKISEVNRLNLVLRSVFWALAIILGFIQTRSGRYLMWYDGPSYLDIADNYLKGDWTTAINACWSPLYSWILGIALFIFHPSPYWELFLVKSVNFVLYLFALFSFDFFLNQIISYSSDKENRKEGIDDILKKPDWVWIVLGYTIFIWSSIVWILVHRDSPDMMVAALVYLATGFVVRIAMNPLNWSNYVILGFILGLSYLSKSFMLPLGFVYIISIIHISDRISLKSSLLRASISALLMLLVALPFITAISLQKQRFTIGDAGKLNYAWYVSPVANDHYWQGSPETGTPAHPVRTINKNPEIIEFATPISGSYPAWYDPSYWSDGIQPKFDLEKQIYIIKQNLKYLIKLFLAFFLLLFFFLASINKECTIGFLRNIIHNWRFFLTPIAGFISFIIFTDLAVIDEPWIAFQTRYIAPFVLMLFVFVVFSVDVKSVLSKKTLGGIVIVSVILANVALLFQPSFKRRTIEYPVNDIRNYHWQVADNLAKMGVRPGDRVAVLGFDDEELYWARLAKVKIIAAMSADYYSSKKRKKTIALNVLKKAGVNALVIPSLPPWVSDKDLSPDWDKIGETKTYIYKF